MIGKRTGTSRIPKTPRLRGKAWSPAEDQTLKRMWLVDVRCRHIAEALGRTRNSVISRANRLELGRHGRANMDYRVKEIA